jgi:PAS domain S-box-containing protein
VPSADPTTPPGLDPLLSGEFGADTLRALRLTLLTLLIVLPMMLIASLLASNTKWAEVLALAALVPAVALLHLMLRAGHVKWTFYGIVTLLIGYGIVGVVLYGSIRSAAVLSFVAAIVVGGIFLQSRALIAAVAVSVTALGLLVLAEQAGWLPRPNYEVSMLHWIVHSLVLGAIALNIFYARRLVLLALSRLEQQRNQRERAESALDETQGLFRSLFRNSPAALMITARPSGLVQDINEAFERIFLIRRDEAVGHTTRELGLWESNLDREAYLAKVTREQRCTDLRLRCRRRNGAAFDAIISSETLLWHGSAHLFSAITDISTESMARDALRASEQRLEAIFRQGPTPILVVDFDRQTLVDMNTAAEQLFGVTFADRSSVQGGALLVAPEKQSEIRQQLEADGFISSTPLAIRNQKTGSIVHVLAFARLIEENGTRYAIYAALDVTSEMKTREALRLSEERFSAAFHFSPIGMTITRLADGLILEVNAADQRTLGYTRDETLGRRTVDNGAWLSPQARQEFVDKLNREGRVLGQETQMRGKNGALVDARLFAQRIELNGELCILAATLNITDEKRQAAQILALNESLELRVRERTAQLESANAELESFSYTVSHDLRSPLRAVNGLLQLLEQDLAQRLSSEERRLMERILDNGRNMARMIDDLLNLSRFGSTPIVRRTTDLSRLALEVARELQEHGPARRVRWDITPGLVAQCDAGLLRIVLQNLLGNAWKYTGRQEAARIRFGSESMPQGGQCLFVADDGCGFDMQRAARLFAPFQRMHSAQEFEGTGIGLATVQRIVNRHGGKIWARSASGQGATFCFTLGPGMADGRAELVAEAAPVA